MTTHSSIVVEVCPEAFEAGNEIHAVGTQLAIRSASAAAAGWGSSFGLTAFEGSRTGAKACFGRTSTGILRAAVASGATLWLDTTSDIFGVVGAESGSE